MALSERKRRFVDAYLTDPCAEHAAKAAGYSADYGRKLLAQREVAAHLKERSDLLVTERIATPVEILELLTKIVRRDDSVCDFEVVKTKTRRERLDEHGKKVVEDQEAQELLKIPPSLRDVMKAAEDVIDRWDKYLTPSGDTLGGVVEIPAVLPGDGEEATEEDGGKGPF